MKRRNVIIKRGQYTAMVVKDKPDAICWIRNDAAEEWLRSGAYDYATRHELQTLPDA